jgi:hypothetical protein
MSTCERPDALRSAISWAGGARFAARRPGRRRPRHDGLALLAGHAAADADDQVGVLLLEVLHPAQVVEDLLLRLLAHRAGVEQDHVRFFGVVGFLEPVGSPEHIRHLVRVVLVHLATEGADIKLFHLVLC